MSVAYAISLFTNAVPPNVLSDPVSIIGIVGERSQLVCEASGSPIPNIEWLIDDQLVANTSRISVLSSVSGLVRTSNVTITDLNFMDTGNYTCRASNNLAVLQSHVSQPALLTVNRKLTLNRLICSLLLLYAIKLFITTSRAINNHEYDCSACC